MTPPALHAAPRWSRRHSFVTFLMSDIEDSTVLLRKLGERYGALLHDVRGILRTAVARAGGREIDARADELFAVFERAPAAIEAAGAIQREVGDRTWAERVEVRLRIGIHSGRPTLTDDGHIGLPVHTTARLCSAAHGGQIVVSGATRAAIGTSAPSGVRFRSLGRHRLPGLPEAETLFQVLARGLRAEFPPPRPQRRASPRRKPDDRRAVRETRSRPAPGQLELPQPPA
jgi:class 3 adenylate cyclase